MAEQRWVLERRDRDDVIAAVLAVADRHDLRFWAHSDDEGISVWVQFPVAGAAELAHALSDLYTSPEEAAHELVAIDRDRYTCMFEIVADAAVYGEDHDNHAAWPLIVAFTDAVVTTLGGEWIDP